MTTDMKAYAVLEECENTGGVVFAKHAIVARKMGANEYNGGEFDGVSCRRAPWADKYFGMDVPVRAMVENGWHFECDYCGSRIDEDYLADTRRAVDGVIGTQHSMAYCDKDCARHGISIRRRRKEREAEAISAFTAIVVRRFPEAVPADGWKPHAHVSHASGGPGWHWHDVEVAVTLPTLTYPVTFRTVRVPGNTIGPRKAGYFCSAIDREAFETYVREHPRP